MKSLRLEAKALLRKVLEEHRARLPYVSVPAVRAALVNAGATVQPATVNRYLVEFLRAGLIHDAGRGWYSSLATPFVLDTHPVEELARLIQKQFRFLKFSCWATDQVKPFMHHLLARSVQFVSTEDHALASAGEFLEGKGFNVYVNPRKSEAQRFVQIKERTVILRPEHSKAPEGHPYASIEKLLVELRGELDVLKLIDVGEFHHLAGEVLRQGRIQISALLSYAEARLFTVEDMLGAEQSIISKE